MIFLVYNYTYKDKTIKKTFSPSVYEFHLMTSYCTNISHIIHVFTSNTHIYQKFFAKHFVILNMEQGFLYLCVVVDWYSRRILSWGISNTHDAQLTTGVLRQALAYYGKSEIFNTDQGCEFTATEFTSLLEEANVKISMDGKGRALDNIFVERFWRTIKYEYVYIAHPTNGEELYEGIDDYIC